MSKFNTSEARPAGRAPITSEATPSGTTFEGGPGFKRDTKSELFLLAVTNMVGENTFYEAADSRDSRFAELVHTVAVEDVDWLGHFAYWLRNDANMRSASLVLAAEAVKARLDKGLAGDNRGLVSSVLVRPDEPGEFIAYWHSRYGRNLPLPVKRGVADAAVRLYSERSLLKYDTASHGVRFADVIRLTHPKPAAAWQEHLFGYAIGKRLGVEGLQIPEDLTVLTANEKVRSFGGELIHSLAKEGHLDAFLRDAGMTWEAVPSLVNGPWTRQLWEAIIPSMGYMALLRNLRNFDQAGVSDKVADEIGDILADPERVAKSRQFPMRFLSAFNAAPSLRWAWALERALDASLSNIPELGGNTLILIDTSGSMNSSFSKDGSLKRWDAATVFGLALARRCQRADVVSFSGSYYSGYGGYGDQASKVFPTSKGESVLKSLNRWQTGGFFIGGGTDTDGAVRRHYSGHDRVVILTDEQAYGRTNVGSVVPKSTPMYTWNLAGYEHGHAAAEANRHTFGGLTDAGFKMIPLLERGSNAPWPWQ